MYHLVILLPTASLRADILPNRERDALPIFEGEWQMYTG